MERTIWHRLEKNLTEPSSVNAGSPAGILPSIINPTPATIRLHQGSTSMTLEQVFFVSQSVAAVGVVASLIFVGLEVRNNAKAIRASTAQAVSDNFTDMYLSISNSPGAAALGLKGHADYGALTSEERARFVCMDMTVFSHCQNAFDQWRSGHLRTDLWVGWESVLMNIVHTPGGAAFWHDRGYMFSNDFQKEVSLAMRRPPDPRANIWGVLPANWSAFAEDTAAPQA
jgi:hypothetical protein